MHRCFKIAVFVLLAWNCLSCKTPAKPPAQGEVLSIPDLGFRYTTPPGMIDDTTPASKEARNHAAAHTGRNTELLLDLSSGEDTAPDWRHVWIFTFPRAQFSALTDSAAEAKINGALAGSHSTAVGEPKPAVLAGRNFTISEYEQREPPLVKHAKIFTTINKGQLISLILVSNSAEQMVALEETLKTLDFSAQ